MKITHTHIMFKMKHCNTRIHSRAFVLDYIWLRYFLMCTYTQVGIVLTVKKIDETHFKSYAVNDFITYTDFHSAFCAAA